MKNMENMPGGQSVDEQLEAIREKVPPANDAESPDSFTTEKEAGLKSPSDEADAENLSSEIESTHEDIPVLTDIIGEPGTPPEEDRDADYVRKRILGLENEISELEKNSSENEDAINEKKAELEGVSKKLDDHLNEPSENIEIEEKAESEDSLLANVEENEANLIKLEKQMNIFGVTGNAQEALVASEEFLVAKSALSESERDLENFRNPKTEKEIAKENAKKEERFLNNADEKDAKDKEVAKKLGIWNTIQKVANAYTKIPFTKKLAIGVALGFGAAASGPLATVFAGGALLQRALAGASAAVFVEAVLAKSVEKQGKERSETRKNVHILLGVISGMIVGNASSLIDNVSAGTPDVPPVETSAEVPPVDGESMNFVDGPSGEDGVVTEGVAGLESYTAQAGDTRWGIISERIPALQDLSEGQKSNAIANILEVMKDNPSEYGFENAEDIHNLAPGEVIDLEKIQNIVDTHMIGGEHIVEHAEGLSAEVVAQIETNNDVIEAFHNANPEIPINEATTTWAIEHPELVENNISYTPETGEIITDTVDGAQETVSALPAEGFSPEVLAQADEIMNTDLDELYGSKGIFNTGFLGHTGAESVDWTEIKGKTVAEVLGKTEFPTEDLWGDIIDDTGFDSEYAVSKAQNYVQELMKISGATPQPGEKMAGFIKRAISSIVVKQ